MIVFADPPLNPSADEARRLLADELRKPKYGDRRGLLERLQDWLDEHLSGVVAGGTAINRVFLLIGLLVIAALIAFGLSRIRRGQGSVRKATDADQVVDLEQTAQQLRDAAARALADGDNATAYVGYFRALARTGVDRTIVSARPGATAHEVTNELAVAFPAHRGELRRAGATFDEVRYGGRTPALDAVTALRELDATLSSSRPNRPAQAVLQ